MTAKFSYVSQTLADLFLIILGIWRGREEHVKEHKFMNLQDCFQLLMQATCFPRWVVGLSAGVLSAARMSNWDFVKTAGGCLGSDGCYGCEPSYTKSVTT